MLEEKDMVMELAAGNCFGLEIFSPPVTSQIALPGGTGVRPLALLFDPGPLRTATARQLATVSGWRVLAVDTRQALNIRTALDLITGRLTTVDQTLYGFTPKWLLPQAIIMEAAHPATFGQQQAHEQSHSVLAQDRDENEDGSHCYSTMTAQVLVHWLHLRGLPLKLTPNRKPSYRPNDPNSAIPVILYTADTAAINETQVVAAAVVRRTDPDIEPLKAVLAHLTGLVYCARCQLYLKPDVRAWLVRPTSIFCRSCAQTYGAVTSPKNTDQVRTTTTTVTTNLQALPIALFPARLLALAAARPFTTNHTSKPAGELNPDLLLPMLPASDAFNNNCSSSGGGGEGISADPWGDPSLLATHVTTPTTPTPTSTNLFSAYPTKAKEVNSK